MQLNKQTKDRFFRFNALEWFPFKQDIILIGAGGIGSHTAFNLSRIMTEDQALIVYDGDIVEELNIGGQLYGPSHVGKNKAAATQEVIKYLTGYEGVQPVTEMYTEESMVNPITIMGVDNMEARKLGFDMWVNNQDDVSEGLFIDGRLTVSSWQIFAINKQDEASIKNYANNYLFDDSEVEELDCNAKQTTHIAAMIGNSITNILVNYLAGYKVPFFSHYISEMTKLYHESK